MTHGCTLPGAATRPPRLRMKQAAVGAMAAMMALTSAPARSQDTGISLIRDAEIEGILRKDTDPVLIAAGLEPSNVEIHLVNNKELNAFVSGGQHIFLFTGMIIKMIALDLIRIGWNGTSAASVTDRTAHPNLEDVNIGWLQKLRTEAPAQVMDAGGAVGHVYTARPTTPTMPIWTPWSGMRAIPCCRPGHAKTPALSPSSVRICCTTSTSRSSTKIRTRRTRWRRT